MGVTGIHPEAGLSTGDFEEANVKYALSQHAAETLVLASREKLGAASQFVVAGLNDVSGLIVDPTVTDEELAPYQAFGLSIIRAE
ncbi:MAG: DeoR family transcriptional regulator, partial [Anaerolineae bacterium]|nr:DeoR family transcriptional regulator [Anaerolineae bacterium]